MMDIFTKLTEQAFNFIMDLPQPLQKQVAITVDEIIQMLNLQNESTIFITVLTKLDVAFMDMDNSTALMIPNLTKLVQWYIKFGTQTLGIWLEALQTESLHQFLVDNQLPDILGDPRNFFCGPSSLGRLSKYFNRKQLPMVQNALCSINWSNVSSEFEMYFLENTMKSKFDIFRAFKIVSRITQQLILPEWKELLDVVRPYYEEFFDHTLQEL